MLKKLLSVALLLGVTRAAIDFRTIVPYLETNTQFTELVTLLRRASLTQVLETPQAIYTVFAPTNAAFSRLSPALLNQILSDTQLLQKVLMGHVVDSLFPSLYMVNDRTQNTLGGSQIRFNIYNQTVTAQGAEITSADIVLRNGVIHVIDSVILPAEGDVLHQILIDDAEFEDLTAAFAWTNLLEDLEFESITLFAPLNTAFQNHYGTGESLPTDVNVVTDLLLNHLVNGTYYPAGLTDGGTLTTLSGHTLTISKSPSGEVVSVNGHATDGVIYATNGHIYVMTDVLAP